MKRLQRGLGIFSAFCSAQLCTPLFIGQYEISSHWNPKSVRKNSIENNQKKYTRAYLLPKESVNMQTGDVFVRIRYRHLPSHSGSSKFRLYSFFGGFVIPFRKFPNPVLDLLLSSSLLGIHEAPRLCRFRFSGPIYINTDGRGAVTPEVNRFAALHVLNHFMTRKEDPRSNDPLTHQKIEIGFQTDFRILP